jgi:hypothetical protein
MPKFSPDDKSPDEERLAREAELEREHEDEIAEEEAAAEEASRYENPNGTLGPYKRPPEGTQFRYGIDR